MNYGIINEAKIAEYAKRICTCLSSSEYNKNRAYNMIIETSIAETGLGRINDATEFAGMGICQFDKLPFEDIKTRSLKHKDKILKELEVDISKVEWEDLRYDSFKSLLFCRLFYMLIPALIPDTMPIRAAYWKQYYNTKFGKGTPEHYIKMNTTYPFKF